MSIGADMAAGETSRAERCNFWSPELVYRLDMECFKPISVQLELDLHTTEGKCEHRTPARMLGQTLEGDEEGGKFRDWTSLP